MREYQPRFEAIRQKLVQIKTLLPAAKVKKAACQTKAPLVPTFSYRTEFDDETNQTENNAEMIMERSLTEPDTRLHYDRSFQYGDTQLLDALHWTGPRGPLGENHFELGPPPAYYDESDDRALRIKLDYGLNTRYAVVLRVLKYTPPTSLDPPAGIGFVARVDLDGFVIDLQHPNLLCSFTASGKYEGLAVINIWPGQTWHTRVYEDLQGSAGREIAKQLESLTGGTVDSPQTSTAWK